MKILVRMFNGWHATWCSAFHVSVMLMAFAGLLESRLALGSPVYGYSLVVDHSADLCKHMQGVFNRDFAHLWDSVPRELYAESGARPPVLFPALPGVEQTKKGSLGVRYSRYPSSGEFDAIPWRLGQIQLGSLGAQPILVAHFDFDNDGHIDTVAKMGFTQGYGDIVNPHGSGALEYLDVWLGQAEAVVTLDPARIEQESPEDRPALVEGWYVRPFLYKSRTYVASYAFRMNANHVPEDEMMFVGEYTRSGSVDPALKRPVLRENVLCRFRMTVVSK